MHIKTENETIRRQLKFIADTVVEQGGIIHPELVITHNAEKLWISCPVKADGSTLLMIPAELFIPVTDLMWSGENGILSYSGDTSQLSKVQLDILNAMVALYNATNKITQVAERFPAQLLPADEELLNWLKDARPEYASPKANSARQFIDTRLNEQTVPDGENEKTIGYLMPLIDLLNNHPYGPKYQRTDSRGWLIALEKPNPGSDECFVRYSKSDSLSNAMWHGYFEGNTRYLASLDCTIQHELLGTVRIKGTNASRRKINAPRILPNEQVLTIQDLVLEQEKLPALLTLLGLAVRSRCRDLNQAQAENIANELIALLVDANSLKYIELQAICQSETDQYSLRTLFGQVANHQLRVLANLKNK